jgi:hypothetical protein
MKRDCQHIIPIHGCFTHRKIAFFMPGGKEKKGISGSAWNVGGGDPHFVASFVGYFVESKRLSGWMKCAV